MEMSKLATVGVAECSGKSSSTDYRLMRSDRFFDDDSNKFVLHQFDGRGKPIKSFEGIRSLLNLWALQNTNGKKKTFVLDPAGNITRLYIGNNGGFPTIEKDNFSFGLEVRNV